MKGPIATQATAGTRRSPFCLAARSLAIAGPGVLLIGALTWPLYLSHSAFAGMWMLEAWYMWKQSLTIGAGHLPSLFLYYSRGALYPEYAFYAGTLDTSVGAISAAVGNAPIATYVLTYLLGFAAAYGGWYWIARQAGLGRWQSHVPGLVFITSSYYLTLIYARGDWPEFIGVSMIPLMIAAGWSVLRSDRLRIWPALALTVSCVFFVGSHVLTLVWGSTTIALVWLAIAICVPQARRETSRHRLSRLAGIAIPAALVSAWCLVPAAVYESSTWIASAYPGWRGLLRNTMHLVSTRHLFTLSRSTASPGNAGFALSLPILVMAWVFVGLVLALTLTPPVGLRRVWTKILLVCASFTALMIVLMTHAGLILALPRYYATLQFSYRLESYVLLGLSGAVLSVLVLAQARDRRLRAWTRWALPPILVIAMVGAIQQAAAYPSTANRATEVASWSQPPSSYEARSYVMTPSGASSSGVLSSSGVFIEYIDVHQPLLNGLHVYQPLLEDVDVHPRILKGSFEHIPLIHFDTASPQGARISTGIHLRPGELVDSNLFGPPSLVHVTGARIVGINHSDGADVLEIDPASPVSGASGPSAVTAAAISVAPSAGLPVVLGRVLSICAVIALTLQLGLLAIRRLRGRGR